MQYNYILFQLVQALTCLNCLKYRMRSQHAQLFEEASMRKNVQKYVLSRVQGQGTITMHF